jgi:hypothetical protein
VGDGQFGGVDPGVDMLPALFSERPFEGAPAFVPLPRQIDESLRGRRDGLSEACS